MSEVETTAEKLPEVRIGIANSWTLATDIVTKGTAELPEYEREQLRWLQRYALGANIRPTELAERIRKPSGDAYSVDSLYQALTGKRAKEGVNLKPLADSIARFRRTLQEVEARSATEFIETPLTRKLFKVFKTAFERNRIAFVLGASQIGKTTAAAEYARRNNHGQTIVLRLPTRGTMTDTLVELGVRLGIPRKQTGSDLRRRLMECFDEHNLLIVDEAHQCLYGAGRFAETAALTLEFIREIHDRRKCGVVFIGTDVLREGLKHNRVLSQLWRRRSPGLVISLPAAVPDADLVEFAAAFGLEAAPDKEVRIAVQDGDGKTTTFEANPYKLQSDAIRTEGLGAWIRLLEDAREAAKEAGVRMTWGRVLAAYCQAQANEAV